ncbi:helix-turn-helix domain-containing protein [Risungbinella massiliensis]|uniref:helix-turn-helix domain-containing protein n=1 Tax=Risungbinella massiliensis TaxID=1329796 RepID=UPI0005CC689A|nr:helix-turn-helix transcriptional regulator [Risungbinella massiliensis]
MNSYSINQLGRAFRKKREEMGVKLEELVEKGISAGTISNFENSKKKVHPNKIIRLFAKIGIERDQLPYLVEQEEEAPFIEKLEIDLMAIESAMDLVEVKQSHKKLIEIKEMNPPIRFQPLIEYLLGKACYKKEKWSKAQQYYLQAIQLMEENPSLQETNIASLAYYGLARSSYRENDLSQALQFIKLGLESFDENGERDHLKYQLLLSKAIYLEKLEQNEEAMDVLSELWNYMERIDTEIALNMYQLTASLYIKSKRDHKALPYILKGIDIARRNENYDRSFELWTTLGTAYLNSEKLDQAKACFEIASKLECKIRRKYLSVQNDIQLGQLYMKEGEFEKAREVLDEAIKKGKKENDAHLLFKALDTSGDCYLQLQELPQALENFERALEIGQKHNFLVLQRELALKLALLYEKRDLFKFQKYSTLHFRLSVQLAQNGGEITMQANENLQYLLNERMAVADPPEP